VGSPYNHEKVEEMLEIRRRLVEDIKLTNQNFAHMNDKLNKIEEKVYNLSRELSEFNEPKNVDLSRELSEFNEPKNVDKLNKIEFKIAEMSEEIDDIKETINVKIKGCLKEILLHILEETEEAAVISKIPSAQEL